MKTKLFGIKMHRAKLKRVLKTLKKKGVVMWEGDDSPKAYAVFQKVLRRVSNGSGYLVHFVQDGCKSIAASQGMAGKFLAFYD